MGMAKEMQILEWQQRWRFVDGDLAVCAKCFEDDAIKDFIRHHASEKKCSYCSRRSKKPIAVPMNEVLELIGDGIRFEYGDPDAEGNPWDEGEYVFKTMSTDEVLDEIGPITENP